MRKLLLSLLLVLLLATGSSAANYYFDLASGNDTTGDGTSGNPWKTIDKCTTSRTGGDECRGAKTTVTTLSGTLTFTNGSTSVSTSSDLTAVVAAGDLVSPNVTTEAWWRVASLTSSVITLNYEYWGPNTASAVTGYKITPTLLTAVQTVQVSGTSTSSRLLITGGWDLSTQIRDGYTAYNLANSATAQGITTNTKNYLEISYFIGSCVTAATGYSILLARGTGNYYHHIYACDIGASYALIRMDNASYNTVFNNIYLSGSVASGFSIASTVSAVSFSDIYIYSVGTGSSDAGFRTTVSGHLEFADFVNVNIYNSYANNLALSYSGLILSFYNCEFSNLNYSTGVSVYVGAAADYLASNIRFFDCNFDGTGGTHALVVRSVSDPVYVKNCTYVTGSTTTFVVSASSASVQVPQLTNCPSGSDCTTYFKSGSYMHDSSASARTGKAIKFTPTSAATFIPVTVGSVKIPSVGSDLTLSAYLKDDASFNGEVWFYVFKDGKYITNELKTPTTSYVKNSVVIGAAALVANEFLELMVMVSGTAGNVWIDDFLAEQ